MTLRKTNGLLSRGAVDFQDVPFEAIKELARSYEHLSAESLAKRITDVQHELQILLALRSSIADKTPAKESQ